MRFARTFWVFSGLLLAAGLASASSQPVYKWKDSGGNVQFTDTPPPPDGTLLKGPKTASANGSRSRPNSSPDDKPMLSAPCRADISAADCDAARRSLQADLEDLERSHPTPPGPSNRGTSVEVAKHPAATRANDCSAWRDVLASLEDRQNDQNPERLTEAARAALPGQIADAERRIAGSCDS